MPRTVDHDARREAICDAVVTIALEDGFAAVTIRRVAALAGASTSVVTHYVAGRDELLALTVRREGARRREQIEEAVGGLAGGPALRAAVEWAVLGATEATHRTWLALLVGAQSEPVLRAELDAFNRWWDRLLRRHARLVGPTPDARVLIDVLDAIVDGLIVAGFDEGAGWSLARRRRALDAVLVPLGL